MSDPIETKEMQERKAPFPPFTYETAIQKVRMAEDAWNTRDASKVALAYNKDTQWRNRAEFIHGRNDAEKFLSRKWKKELDYRLIKELWAVEGNRIAVRYAYECFFTDNCLYTPPAMYEFAGGDAMIELYI
ncbi:hypothetical protein XNC1_2266 [Xenorhabdus nematophila ATCC 19061]|uniref:Nuclear transport factor 2 family protein n=1 Tax=Xenorhabdus nematophila (strain ATCC 19061 / DSM 3370 / CCUG 14189 / LMG 1036 / NCIMB 9965 / AN6) TaxID=406817 RepID=D3VFL1_XENNA|nr:hypothetical protein XNC1_2266 [Xenorhabdus nematophila ATCC 19061]CEK23181.1 hypothetical protein XNC2_2187 [Xenorhabdus nematophila AN6/1]